MNKEESDLIIAEQNKSTEKILKAVAKVKSDYKELSISKDTRIAKLEKENEKLKETLTVGTTWNKHLNSRNKALEEESDKYRNMLFDKMEQLDRAKKIIKKLYSHIFQGMGFMELNDYNIQKAETEQFLKEVEK